MTTIYGDFLPQMREFANPSAVNLISGAELGPIYKTMSSLVAARAEAG